MSLAHIVFLEGMGAGHINPTVPLIAAFVKQSCKVTYFACAESPHAPSKDDLVSRDTSLGQAVLAAGAELNCYREDDGLKGEPLLAGPYNQPWLTLPGILQDLKNLSPPASVILYDPMAPVFAAAAEILKIPRVTLIPHSGPGIMSDSETEQFKEMFASPREWLQTHYKLDLFDLGIPPASWYAPKLNLCLTSEEFFSPISTDQQKAMFGESVFKCVGTMNEVLTTRFRPDDSDFPLGELRAAKSAGKRIVYLSLGSALTNGFLERPMPWSHVAGNIDQDNTAINGKILAEMTGGDFAKHAFGQAFAALGEQDDILVVLSCGARGPDEVLQKIGLADKLPSNFRTYGFVPQLDLLPLCSCFITHGGMGSVMESLLFRVPVVVIPGFGDQMWNADCCSKAGLGFGFRYPLKTLTAETLEAAIMSILDTAAENPYVSEVEAFARKAESTGGPQNAARLVLNLVSGVAQ